MDFSLSPEQQQIRDEVRKLCLQFDDNYWLEKDRSGVFPHELPRGPRRGRLARHRHAGGIRRRRLGITEAAIMMQAIAEVRRGP